MQKESGASRWCWWVVWWFYDIRRILMEPAA